MFKANIWTCDKSGTAVLNHVTEIETSEETLTSDLEAVANWYDDGATWSVLGREKSTYVLISDVWENIDTLEDLEEYEEKNDPDVMRLYVERI